MAQPGRDRVGAGGYGCLVALAALGSAGGGAALLWGLATFLRARQQRLATGEDAAALLVGLEGAVAWVGAGTLALLVAAAAGVVLLKELSDEAHERTRGPIR